MRDDFWHGTDFLLENVTVLPRLCVFHSSQQSSSNGKYIEGGFWDLRRPWTYVVGPEGRTCRIPFAESETTTTQNLNTKTRIRHKRQPQNKHTTTDQILPP